MTKEHGNRSWETPQVEPTQIAIQLAGVQNGVRVSRKGTQGK